MGFFSNTSEIQFLLKNINNGFYKLFVLKK